MDPAYGRSVDELFDPALMSMPAVIANAQLAKTALSDAELSHAWCASYRALCLSHDPRDQARIAAARACYWTPCRNATRPALPGGCAVRTRSTATLQRFLATRDRWIS